MLHLCAKLPVSASNRVFILGLCLWTLSALSHAACSRPITVAASPLGLNMRISPQGNISGLDVDYLKKISNISGCEFKFIQVSRIRGLTMFEHDEIEVLTSASKTPGRDAHGWFSPFAEASPALITLRGAYPNPHKALYDGRIVLNIVLGYDFSAEYRDLVDMLGKKNLLEKVSDPATAIKKVLTRHGDAFIIPAPAAAYIIKELNLDTADFNITPLSDWSKLEYGLYLNKSKISKQDMELLKVAARNRKLIDDTWVEFNALTPAWGMVGVFKAGSKQR